MDHRYGPTGLARNEGDDRRVEDLGIVYRLSKELAASGNEGTFGLVVVYDESTKMGKVLAIDDGGPAATAGINKGDLVHSIMGITVEELETIMIHQLLWGDTIEMGDVLNIQMGSGKSVQLTAIAKIPTE